MTDSRPGDLVWRRLIVGFAHAELVSVLGQGLDGEVSFQVEFDEEGTATVDIFVTSRGRPVAGRSL